MYPKTIAIKLDGGYRNVLSKAMGFKWTFGVIMVGRKGLI